MRVPNERTVGILDSKRSVARILETRSVRIMTEEFRDYVKIIRLSRSLNCRLQESNEPLSPWAVLKERNIFMATCLRFRSNVVDSTPPISQRRATLRRLSSLGFHGPSAARVPRERAENREFYDEYHSEPSFVARVLRDYSCLLSKYTRPWPWPNTFFLSSRRLFRTWREINRFSLSLRTYTSTWDVFMHRLSPFSRACW